MGDNKRVFISYAWGGESERIVNELDADLQARGILLVRDKRDLGFKGLIRDFMRQIGQGHAVIVVISDKYLKSRNCMFELVEIAKNKDLYDRVFPIVLEDADIREPVNRLKYVQHWEDKMKELDERIKSLASGANLQGVREELDSYDDFRDNISNLTSFLNDMNTFTAEIQENTNFAGLISDLEKRLATGEPATPVPPPSQEPAQSASKSASAAPARAVNFDGFVESAIDRLARADYKELRGERAGRVRFKKAMERIHKAFLGKDCYRCLFVECEPLTVESFESIEKEVNLYGKELSKRLIQSMYITCVVLAGEVPESVQQLIYDTKPPKVGISDISMIVMVAYSAAENDIFYPRDLPDDFESKFEEDIKQYLLP